MKRALLIFLAILFLLSGCYNSDIVNYPSAGLEINFIDVGQADAALIICDGKTVLVDGGNSEDSNLIYNHLQKLSVSYIDVIILTHADEDHVGGLSGALSYADAGRILAPETEADTRAYRNFKEKAESRGIEIEHPKAGECFSLGGGLIEILGPVHEDYSDRNNTSIVFKLTYGSKSFLFTGDAEQEAEGDILDAGFDVSADVLKVGHHGSRGSSSYRFLREVMPSYAVISCGRNNDYGHPHEEALSRLTDCGAEILRTDISGDIILTCDGENISFNTAPVKSGEKKSAVYIGNKKSKIFHTMDCDSLPSYENITVLFSREKAVEKGYKPCGGCKP